MFLPVAAKYLDLPGLIASLAPRPLWLAGQDAPPAMIAATYDQASQSSALVTFTGEAEKQQAEAIGWLLE
ncbi:hypothetical protein [Allorhodopirellula solitaria]|nr:hypothetical protein [Allorhodopirellula solitaria]